MTGNSTNDVSTPVSMLAYRDQTLQECNIIQIGINLDRSINARLPEVWWGWSATYAYATTMCQIWTGITRYNVTFRLDLPHVRNSGDIPPSFLTQNGTGRQALWYGVLLTRAWYEQISRAMSYAAPPDTADSYGSGQILLSRNTSVSDFRDLNFFTINYGQPSQNGGVNFISSPATFSDWASGHYHNLSGANGDLPPIAATINAFAVSFYSLLLSDFGISGSTNALSTQAGVLYIQNLTDPVALNASEACTDKNMCGAGSIGKDAQDAANLGTIHPTQLTAQYLCSTPRQRAGISIFFSVVLAEIVYLQGCWALFSLIATWYIGMHNSQVNYCPGCVTSSPVSRPKLFTKYSGATTHSGAEDTDSYSLTSATASQPLIRRTDTTL